MTDPRRFYLQRHVDITGTSGTGRVADGVQWPDGTVSIRWAGDRPSVVFWDGIDDAEWVHGHAGATRIVWLDDAKAPDHHVYLSTGCLHGEHTYCQGRTGQAGAKKPAECKWCAAKCRCSCHDTTGAEVRPISVPLLEDADPPINLGDHIAGYNDMLAEEG